LFGGTWERLKKKASFVTWIYKLQLQRLELIPQSAIFLNFVKNAFFFMSFQIFHG